MQQATVNLFADMGVQPLTLQAGLVTAAASTDTLAPTSHDHVPDATAAASRPNTTVTITGTAADNGGGLVGGVEVSVDGGATWHPRDRPRPAGPTSGRPAPPRTVTIFSRAVDDSGNIRARRSAGVSVTVGGTSATCPCSIWVSTPGAARIAGSGRPAPSSSAPVPVRRRGFITAIRFYKSPQNTGPHVGNLWTTRGTQLATVTFTGESASGWQQATLGSPVAIAANTTYVVSYHTNSGFYCGTTATSPMAGIDNGPLHAPRDGSSGANGVYRYGASAFPTETFNSENYWVDVVFVTSGAPDTTPPQVSDGRTVRRARPASPTNTDRHGDLQRSDDRVDRQRHDVRAARRRATRWSPRP